jgi:hypothetical protein
MRMPDGSVTILCGVGNAPPTRRPIHGLTVCQPWPELLCRHGVQIINTTFPFPRALRDSYLAVHASALVSLPTVRALAAEGLELDPAALPTRAIVAVAQLASWAESPESQNRWWRGPVAWYLRGVTPITPIPTAGGNRLWTLDTATLAAVRTAYGAALRANPTREAKT